MKYKVKDALMKDLRKLLESPVWNQALVAQRLRVAPETVNRWLNHKKPIKAKLARRLARLLIKESVA